MNLLQFICQILKKRKTPVPLRITEPPRPGTEMGLTMTAYERKSSLKGCPVGPLAAFYTVFREM